MFSHRSLALTTPHQASVLCHVFQAVHTMQLEQPNAGAHLLPELGRRKRVHAVRFLSPPENRTYGFHRIRLSTGRSPWGYQKHLFHAAAPQDSPMFDSISPAYTRNSRGQLRVAGYLFADYSLYTVLPKARGLHRNSPGTWLPTLRLLCPIRLSVRPWRFVGVSLPYFPLALTSLTKFPVRCRRLKRHE